MGCSGSSQRSADLAASQATPAGHGYGAGAAAMALSGAAGLSSPVELSISADGLPSLDTLSASDCMCVVSEQKDGRWVEVGRTEVTVNSNNPHWVTMVRVNYHFEKVQNLMFRIYDIDSTMRSQADRVRLESQDFVGELQCQLARIMGSRGSTFRARIINSKNNKGTLTVRGEEIRHVNDRVTIQFRASKLANKDTFGKSDPFLRLSRVREDGSSVPCFKTEVIMNNLSPTWQPFNASMQRLCNGDPHRPLLIQCFDYDTDGTHELIGQVQSSVDDILRRQETGGFTLVNPAKPGKAVGELFVVKALIMEQPSFLDYIAGGMQISFSVAIDFTASNGEPSDPASLHYIAPSGHPNSYQLAIQATGQVLEFYDSDRMFEVKGFGGVPPGARAPLHSFPLAASEVHGVQGIIDAYKHAIHSTRLAGPTLFSQIINEAAARVASLGVSQTNQQYEVLLIITDGIITDLDQTIASIVNASALPLSILIVGVGPADFSAMEALDGDKRRLSAGGRVAARDIVQFVAMRDHMVGRSLDMASGKVSEELLAEIPGQVLSFMMANGIRPNPRPVPNFGSLALSHDDIAFTMGGGAGRAQAVPPPSAPGAGAGMAHAVPPPATAVPAPTAPTSAVV